MKITLIASDEATAPLYRVRTLARVLMRFAEVEVLGFCSRPDLKDSCPPRDFPYREFPARPWPRFASDARALARFADGDVLYAMKPRPTSLGVALAIRSSRPCAVMVDVDDDERYMVAPYSRHPARNLLASLPRLADPNAWPYVWLTERKVARADAVTVVSAAFGRRFGGFRIPQVADCDLWNPERFPKELARARFGLSEGLVAAFCGIAQPNKGPLDALQALRALADSNWTFLIAGPPTPHARELAQADTRVRIVGTLPPDQAPWALAAADLVVLPQRFEPVNYGQVPMKLVEAMAMERAVVATALSDIPEILGPDPLLSGEAYSRSACGWLVPAGNSRALADAIGEAAADRETARLRARNARRRVRAHYSYDRAETLLRQAIASARLRAAAFGPAGRVARQGGRDAQG